jgi:hypothetical protein
MIPITAQKAMVNLAGQHIWLTRYSPSEALVTTVPRSLAEFIATSIHPDTRWATVDFMTTDNSTAIAAVLTSGTCLVAVSDGSFKNEFGTASWIIQVGCETGGWEIGKI